MIERGLSKDTVSQLRFYDFQGALDNSQYHMYIKWYLKGEDVSDRLEERRNMLDELESYIDYEAFNETQKQLARKETSSEIVSNSQEIMPSAETVKMANDTLNQLLNKMDNSAVERGI